MATQKMVKVGDNALISPHLFRKIRGGNIAPKPSGLAWKGLFGQWDWNNWIKPQVDRAVALGLNAIRLIGAPEVIFVDPITTTLPKISQATYDAQWSQLAEYCLSKGIYLYPCLISKWDVLDVYGVGGNFQDATMTASVKTTAANLARYPNVIGFDIFQEGDAGTALAWAPSTAYALNAYANLGGNSYKVTTAGTSASSGGPTGTGSSITDNTVVWAYQSTAILPADVLAMMAAVRSVTSRPLTMSRSLSDGFGWNDTTSMWYSVFNSAAGADFLDVHLYIDGILPGDPDFQVSRHRKPLLIGEYGARQSESAGVQTARLSAVAAVANRRGVTGSFVWALADQDTVSANQFGVWDNTGYAAGTFPAASTAPLSVTAGARTTLTNLLPTFAVADRPDAYVQPNLLSPTQAKPRNANTTAATGWLGGANTYLYAEPRGLGFSATATGTSFVAISMLNQWRIPVAAATYYRAKASLLAGATARTVSFYVDWYDSAGAYISSSTAFTGTDDPIRPLLAEVLVRSHSTAAYGVLIAKVTDATQAANEAHIVLDAELVYAQ